MCIITLSQFHKWWKSRYYHNEPYKYRAVPFIELNKGLNKTGFFMVGCGYIYICPYLDKRGNVCNDCKDRFVCFTAGNVAVDDKDIWLST